MDVILKYFPNLTLLQKKQLEALGPLYKIWNNKINVISRKDIDNLYLHHILHSLAIAKFLSFTDQSKIIDVGTGGGFPGIPLAIMFPNVQFTLLDSVGKKIKVVNEIIREIELTNVKPIQARSKDFKGKFDFIVSRAVSKLPDFAKQTQHLISSKPRNAVSNGILYLKGGNLEAEIAPFRRKAFVAEISDWFEEPYFETKKLVHLPL